MRAVLWKPPLHLATAGFCERCSSKDVVALVCVYDLSVPPASGPGLWATMDGLSPGSGLALSARHETLIS